MTYPTADELEEAICALESECFANGMKLDNNEALDTAREAVNTQIKALLHRLSIAERTVEALGIKHDKLIREHGERVALMEAALEAADGMRSVPPVVGAYSLYDAARAKTREP